MTDKECGRGSGGEHTGIVIHSLILPVVYFPTVPLSFAVLCFIILPLQKRHLSLCMRLSLQTGSNTKPKSPLKMQMGSICGLLLSESERFEGRFCVHIRARVCACMSERRGYTRCRLTFTHVLNVSACLHLRP